MIWPWVSKAMKRGKWSCYLHNAGGIALSTRQSVPTLTARLVEAFRSKQCGWSNESLNVDDKKFPFLARVLVSGKEKDWNAKRTNGVAHASQANLDLARIAEERI